MPDLALVFNAFVWGVSWWPFRLLGAQGLHPLWATAVVYLPALAAVLVWRPGALAPFLRRPGLWLLALTAGLTNACFNWGVTQGDVVRVVLLFYLMPVWMVLLAWPLLGERPDAAALGRMGLGLAGVAVVLHAPGTGWPLPRSLPDLLGLAGGLCFALTNVLLRRLRDTPDAARTLAMFAGGLATAATIAAVAKAAGTVAAPPAWSPDWVLPALALAAGFLAGNVALQYGAARLPAHRTALVMLSEVVFAAASAVALGAAAMAPHVAVGGAMVVLAAAWGAIASRRAAAGPTG